jgi:hypothetical protein
MAFTRAYPCLSVVYCHRSLPVAREAALKHARVFDSVILLAAILSAMTEGVIAVRRTR